MDRLKIAIVAPASTFEEDKLELAYQKAESLGFAIANRTKKRSGQPPFLNGAKVERLNELQEAEMNQADAIWCVRGGCGAIELWHSYQKEHYQAQTSPLIGYSDITILHFMRYYRAMRIGIHGPGLFDLIDDTPHTLNAVLLLIKKQADLLSYPPLKALNHFLSVKLSGELIVMNLASLQTLIGVFEPQFFRGKILALEDVNEPHHRVFAAMQQLKNTNILTGLKALVLGHFGPDRNAILDDTMIPLATELGLPLFDWPIFGHEHPNWPMLFGAKVSITKIDQQSYILNYDEQVDHTPISHDYY